MSFSINKIDTSYWNLDDKEWLTTREKRWQEIEFMISPYKHKKKNRNIVKDYFMKGKMPNWAKLNLQDCSERHLDIFLMLWLHPSRDKNTLKDLRDLYLESEFADLEDIKVGYKNFFSSQITVPIQPYIALRQVNFPRLDGDTELYFDLLMGERKREIFKLKSLTQLGHEQVFQFPKAAIGDIITIGLWLSLKTFVPEVHYGFLYQYDDALEWWYETFEGLEYSKLSRYDKEQFTSLKYSMYKIYKFETGYDDEGRQSKLASKITSMLDEREFFPEFKQLWLDVKAGNVDLEDFKGLG